MVRRSRIKIEAKSSVAIIFQRGLSGSVVIFSMYISRLKECFLNIWFIRTKIYVLFWNRSLVNIKEYEYALYSFFISTLFIISIYIRTTSGEQQNGTTRAQKKIMRQYSLKRWQKLFIDRRQNRKTLFLNLNWIVALIFTKGDEHLKPRIDILSSREEKEIVERMEIRWTPDYEEL